LKISQIVAILVLLFLAIVLLRGLFKSSNLRRNQNPPPDRYNGNDHNI